MNHEKLHKAKVQRIKIRGGFLEVGAWVGGVWRNNTLQWKPEGFSRAFLIITICVTIIILLFLESS